jgi:hypothetical protein
MTSPTETAAEEKRQPTHPFHGVVPDFVLADWIRAMLLLGCGMNWASPSKLEDS